MPNFFEITWTAVIFRFFMMAAAAILNFPNLKFLTFGTVKRVELRNRAKFCGNRSNRGPDMVIFHFSKMAAVAILHFKNFKFVTVGTVKKVKLHQCAKLHRNRSNRGRDMWFQCYASLALKSLFTPSLGFFGAHFPQMMSLIVLPQTGPSLGGTTSFEP